MKSAREIVSEGWRQSLIHREQLLWLGFVPSFFSILVSAGYIFYQAQAFRSSPFFEMEDNRLLLTLSSRLWDFLNTHSPLFFSGTGIALFLLVGWIALPMLCRGAITHAISSAYRNEEIREPLKKSTAQFFPLFSTAVLKRALEPTAFFTEWSFTARSAGLSAAAMTSPLLIFLALVGAVSLFFFSFTTQSIAIKNKNLKGAIALSARTVSEHFAICFRLIFIFLLIELRVLLNVLVVLLLPLLLLGAGGFLANLLSPAIGFFLVGALAVILLFVTASLTGILFVLSEAIWTIAFLEFEKDTNEKN